MIYLSVGIQHVIGMSISLFAIVIGLWMLKKFLIAKFHCTEEAQVIVQENIEKSSSSDNGSETSYFCSYTYCINNNKFTNITNVAQSSPYQIGASLTIMYNPEKLKQHYVVESNYLTIMLVGSLLFLILGTIFTTTITVFVINN